MAPSISDSLKADIHLLGGLLGEVVRRSAGQEAFDLEEEIRAATRSLRTNPSTENAVKLRDRLDGLGLPDLRMLIRAFSLYFDLINLAEQQARVRAIRQRTLERWPEPMSESPEEAIRALKEQGVTAEQLAEHLSKALVSAVFTAHPSEARRRTILEKLTSIAGHLDRMEYASILPAERDLAVRAIAGEIETFWLTDTIRSERPTVLDEVRNGTEVVEASLLRVLPRVYRHLEESIRRVYPEYTGSVPPFLRFGSWIGGDRDGNPFVTHTVTAETLRFQQESVLTHYLELVSELGRKLSHTQHSLKLSPEFIESLRHDAEHFPAIKSRGEPFRDKCRYISARLKETRKWVHSLPLRWSDPETSPPPAIYFGRHKLYQDLRLLSKELETCSATAMAHGEVLDLLRLVEVFGVHLLTLDVRQHSLKHTNTLTEVFRWAGLHTDYGSLNPEEKFAFLALELERSRPLIPTHLPFSAEAIEVIETFRTISAILEQQCPEAIETYIISNTTEAAHLLEVLLLAREARLFRPDSGISRLQIVPLFESLEPLRTGTAILDKLYALPIWRKHLQAKGNLQEVMIGYSDSSKESGSLMSAWSLYRVQCDVSAAAAKQGITIQFFHGRGGAVGRGGGPANRAILAQPRGTVNDRMRITEQGEMIADRYGHPAIAERHLEQVINAVLRASFTDEKETPHPDWEAALGELSEHACRHYRGMVYENPEFLTYFFQATPIAEISQFRIGSRPARRGNSADGIDQLRAIPWVFSWMQSRHTLPGWYGLGSALKEFIGTDPQKLELARTMYQQWPFWASYIDNAQMILAKADMTIARLYADLVEDKEIANRVFGRIEEEYKLSVDMICRITQQNSLLEKVPVLQRSIRQRNPYVDPLSFIQIVILKRLRGSPPDREALLTAVLESISGIAAGLKNTG